ncbi:MAG: hypothetical protein K8T91_28090 [Planctomycetes bacterium]|nr:hypothetical protein [Planctomycetota bacterium]
MHDPRDANSRRYRVLSMFAMTLGIALAIFGLAGGPPYLALAVSGVVFALGIGWAYAARVSSARN